MDQTRVRLVEEATQKATPFWKRVAGDLSKAGRNRRIVNLARLSRVTKAGETVIVPGKVLGDGTMDHKLTIIAHTFSASAVTKLTAAGCTMLSIEEFMQKNPKGSARIIG